ncbi:MAG: LysR family transcriptional regulator [Sporomusaceae bacterium]|nr:LysR family transcriptional regulator [Sporomusaceae bacterium]
MDIRFKMFLLAVEEMNFTKAACRAFVTQQCLSFHIKKIETEYGLKLFERNPELHLTPAGESLYHSLRQIQVAETAMLDKLSDIKAGIRGQIIFGINATRARILLPDLFTEYHQRFPLIKLSIILDDMRNLVPKLLNGKIDMFLGIDCTSNNNFNVLPLGHDEVFFIATETILQKFALSPDIYQQTLASAEIDLLGFPNLPFAGNYEGSSFNNLVKRYLDSRNIHQEIVLSVSDYELQIGLCIRNHLAAFCPKSVLDKVIEQNSRNAYDKPLRILKLCGMKDSLRIDLITHKNAYQPYFSKEFISLLQEHIQKYDQLTARFIGSKNISY